MTGEWQLINNKEEWEKYTNQLDEAGPMFVSPHTVRKPYKHKHNGEPKEFPCLIQSICGYDPNGPYYYDHNFVYYEDAVALVNVVEEQT